jgi:adenylate kinase family enzyme
MGDICREMFAKGDYLKPQMILDVLEKWFKENKINKNGMILDGGLRTLEETEGFQGMLDKTGKRFFVDVICIRVPGWKAYERSYDRQRFNDTPKEILRRLGSYYDNLGLRMVTIRNNNWPVHIIDANETKDEVFQNVLGVVGTKNKLSCGLFSYLRSFR